MSTRSQKRKTTSRGVEQEEPELLDQGLTRVLSTESRQDISCGLTTSVNENVVQNASEVDNLKATLRNEIAEEKKILFAQSQKAII